MNDYYFFHIIFIIYSIIIYKYRENIAIKLKLMDYPDNVRKSHKYPIACIGGIIIFPYLISSILILNNLSIIKTKILLIWIFLFSSFFFIGLLDDRYNLSAKTKTFMLTLILFITLPLDKSLIIQNLDFKNLDLFISLNEGSLFFTIFSIYFLYNALNFSDGYNGISISISLYFLVILVTTNQNLNMFYISLFLGLSVVLIPNLLNKLFIGNSGVSLLSIILSILVIESYNKNTIYFDEIILIFFLPIVDAARITIERISYGKSPFESDKKHFHHLLAKFLKEKYVFILYLFVTTIPFLLTKLNVATYISLIISFIVYFSLLFYLKNKKTVQEIY